MPRTIPWAGIRLPAALALAAALLACRDSTTAPLVPARIEIRLGDAQTGVVLSELPIQPTIAVLTASGKPVPDATVIFELPAGGGQLSRFQQSTDARGMASAGAWTLGTRAGSQTLTASVMDAPDVKVTLTAHAQPGEAVRLVLKRLASANAASGLVLSTTPSIQIGDVYGNAVARAGVVVTASAGSARVRNDTATTDSAGAATFTGFALSGTPGTYVLRFTAPSFIAVDANLVALSIGPAAKLALVVNPPSNAVSGIAFDMQPVIELQDDAGNRVTQTDVTVTASVASGFGVLGGEVQAVTSQGRAIFSDLRLTGSGAFRINFSAPGVASVSTSDILIPVVVGCPGTTGLLLDFALGQTARYRADQTMAPQCLQFDQFRNRDQQFLVMIENMPRTGGPNGFGGGLFPGPESGFILNVNVAASGLSGMESGARAAARQMPSQAVEPHSWNFGEGEIYEGRPTLPAGGVPAPRILRGRDQIAVNSADAAPAVGDTMLVYLAGVERLGTFDGDQRAVIRHVSDELIIAEDTRLATMPRAGGGFNTPLTQADLDSISRAYAAHSRAQSDLLFGGRHNRITEAQTPPRIVAVHTLMFADNVWGYTYMTGNVFAWDFWVLTNGSTKGLAQHPLRNAHNLFMHEVAHMRHWGLLEYAGRQNRLGNTWLIEGFARFSERLPIASYLLNNANPSRTGNATLGAYPEFGGPRFREDVPSYLNVSASMLDGYAASSYVFDYLADQVAAAGGDWHSAIARFVTSAGTEADANAVVGSLLPGLTFEELFTRARIAAYTDDLPDSALPGWTQYHQFNLRASREPSTAASFDPRNAWPRIQPGTAFAEQRSVFPGAAFGYLIDGMNATSSGRLLIDFGTLENAVLSVTRIR